MKNYKKILLTAASSLIIASVAVISSQSSAYALEYDITEDVPMYDTFLVHYSGEIKALVVRVGFSDYPADESNYIYNGLSPEYLRSLYEGREGGFGQPYNGLADYLNKASYGKVTMTVGDIIDIQMDGPLEDYCDSEGILRLFDDWEFCNKLYAQIDPADYDYDINALYIWSLGSNSIPHDHLAFKVNVWIRSSLFGTISSYTVMSEPELYLSEGYPESSVINILAHETGHMIGAKDYYLLDTYPLAINTDIGNIMGYGDEQGDYDAWTKWIQKWLTKDNAIGIVPENGETGRVELTPYDSSTDEGKKIVLFKYDDGYIAADFSGGINNNDLDTDLRTRGFRFYKLDRDTQITEIYNYRDGTIIDPDMGEILLVHQLFAEGEEIEDLLYDSEGKTFRITDIDTGENPSFVYTYTDNTHGTDAEDPDLRYVIRVVDEDGNNLLDDNNAPINGGIDTTLVSQDDYIYGYYGNETSNTYNMYERYNEDLNLDTVLRISGIPANYNLPGDIQLVQRGSVLTTDSANVISITEDPLWKGTYEITVQLKNGYHLKYYFFVSGEEDGGMRTLLNNGLSLDIDVGETAQYEQISSNGFYIFGETDSDQEVIFGTVLKINVPEGYKEVPDINFSQRGADLTADSPYVTEIKNPENGIYIININLEKEQDPLATGDDPSEQGNDPGEQPGSDPEEPVNEPDGSNTKEPQAPGDDPAKQGENDSEQSDDNASSESSSGSPDGKEEQPGEGSSQSDGKNTGSGSKTAEQTVPDNNSSKTGTASGSQKNAAQSTSSVKASSGNNTPVVVAAKSLDNNTSLSGSTSVPKTGDKTGITARLAFAGASAGAMAAAVIIKRKKKCK